jgi:hypothetical protein
MITLDDYYMGREGALTAALRANAAETVFAVNALLAAFGESRAVRSGFRPPAVNAATPNAAPNSKHMTCQACDLDDPDGDLDEWALDHPEILERLGLFQEHPASTKSWAHFQTVPPKSGRRVFYP